MTLRTSKTEARYQKHLKVNKCDKCIFCEGKLIIKEYKYWVKISNRFSYDKIAKVHHMIAPKRHVAEIEDLYAIERYEMYEIIKEKEYHYSQLNNQARRSIKGHLHLHLIQEHD